MIQNTQDLRTGEVITLENDTINYSLTRKNANSRIRKNKKIVLN